MTLEETLSIFDAWEPIEKARKPKGLKNWGRLSHIAHKLDGKSHKDISFTTAYPGKEGQVKILGSIEGNQHFLLGYGNPGFHMAAYHWQIIDPNLSDEEAEELHKTRGHPSRPELWRRAEMEDKPEGDLELGMPHPSAIVAQEKARRESEGIRVTVGAGVYLAVPSEGLVYGEHNGHIYKWDLLKDSFMSAVNPELTEAMNAAEEARMEKSERTGPLIPDMILHRARNAESFDDEVYPLVKSLFPQPGSVLPLDTYVGETVYGVVCKSYISFFDRQGHPVHVLAWDRAYEALDLRKGGDTHASVLYNFGLNHLGLDRNELELHIGFHHEISELPLVVKGMATEGFDDVPNEYVPLDKSVEVVGHTYRLVVRANS